MTVADEARRLYAETPDGYKRIGQRLGVSRDRVRAWIRPEREQARRRRKRREEYERNTPARVARLQRRALLVILWTGGVPTDEIGRCCGMTRTHVLSEVDRLRRLYGYDLPYRQRRHGSRS